MSRYEAEGEVATVHPAHEELRFVYADSLLYINPDECTSCDACRPERPVDAIFSADDVPADQQDFIEVDRFVFADISC